MIIWILISLVIYLLNKINKTKKTHDICDQKYLVQQYFDLKKQHVDDRINSLYRWERRAQEF